jgi:autotransporter-associated beta strand protein
VLNPVDVEFQSGSNRWNYFTMGGTNQEIGSIIAGTGHARTVIQSWDGPADANRTKTNDPATLLVNQSVNTTYGGRVRNAFSGNGVLALTLDSSNNSTLGISGATTYTGDTRVMGGTLRFDSTTRSPNYQIDSGAVLDFNVARGTRDMPVDMTFTGGGTLRKSGNGLLVWGQRAANFNLDAGSWIDIAGGTFVAGSWGNENWDSNLSSLNIASGATFRSVEAEVRIDALTGGGYLGRWLAQQRTSVARRSSVWPMVWALVDPEADATR